MYRLVTCGTVEEKIYRRQAFKMGLSSTTTQSTTDADTIRYFSQQDIRALFDSSSPAGFEISETQRQLKALHGHQRLADAPLTSHIARLERHPLVAGISDHDLLFHKDEHVLVEEQRLAQSFLLQNQNPTRRGLRPTAGAGASMSKMAAARFVVTASACAAGPGPAGGRIGDLSHGMESGSNPSHAGGGGLLDGLLL